MTATNNQAWRALLLAAARCDCPGPAQDARRTFREGEAVRRAAVLIGITDTAVPSIYFTERSAALTHHPGQISFPGGRIEAGDASPAAAAIREAHEEIGLDPADVEILGALPCYRTVTGFAITPIVAWIKPDAPVRIEPGEVEHLFTVPVSVAFDATAFRYRRITRAGQSYRIYSLDYDGHHIWGATAAMLATLASGVAKARGERFAIVSEALADARGGD